MKASLLYPSDFILAEGPLWHPERNSFFWVDIEGKTVNEFQWNTKEVVTTKIPYRVSLVTMVSGDKNKLLLGVQGGLVAFDLTTGNLTWLLNIEAAEKEHRTNDGKCDAHGRLWVGTMHLDCVGGKGSLYCVDKNFQLTKKLSNLSIPNGLAWTVDIQHMYYIDSPTFKIQSYYFDVASGEITFEKTAVHIPQRKGSPDGMTIDEEGMLWVAHWGGSCVCRWDPIHDQLIDEIQLPVPLVTSCAFGGPGMNELIITTARQGLSAEELKQYPLSGSIFSVELNVKGRVTNSFGTSF